MPPRGLIGLIVSCVYKNCLKNLLYSDMIKLANLPIFVLYIGCSQMKHLLLETEDSFGEAGTDYDDYWIRGGVFCC